MSLTNSFSSLSSSFSYDFRRLEYFGRDVCGRVFTSRSICSSFNVNIHNIQQCNHIPSELVAHCLNAYSTEYPTQNIMIIAWHQHTKEDTKTNIKLLLDDGNILLIPKIDITRILVLMLLDSFHRHCTLTDIVHSQTLYTHRHCTLTDIVHSQTLYTRKNSRLYCDGKHFLSQNFSSIQANQSGNGATSQSHDCYVRSGVSNVLSRQPYGTAEETSGKFPAGRVDFHLPVCRLVYDWLLCERLVCDWSGARQ